MAGQDSTPHLDGNEIGGMERELRELRGLVLRMPDKVKHRVTNSHMEIETLCKYLQSLDLSQCRTLYLLHLSNAASNEGNFANRVRRVVPRHIEVIVCAE